MNKKVLCVIVVILILILLTGLVFIFVMSNSGSFTRGNENTAKETTISEQSSEKTSTDPTMDTYEENEGIFQGDEILINNEDEDIEDDKSKPAEDAPAVSEEEMKSDEIAPPEATDEEATKETGEATSSPTEPSLINDNDNATSWG